MKVLLINGFEEPDFSSIRPFFTEFIAALRKDVFSEHICLKDKKISPCKGCFDCWVKTPGKCSLKDEHHEIAAEYINSDLVIFASPLKIGFLNALTKNAMDRLIPLLHPYIHLVNNECHHQPRYTSYPKLGFIVQKEIDSSEDELLVVKKIMERFALNFQTKLHIFETTDKKPKSIANELSNI